MALERFFCTKLRKKNNHVSILDYPYVKREDILRSGQLNGDTLMTPVDNIEAYRTVLCCFTWMCPAHHWILPQYFFTNNFVCCLAAVKSSSKDSTLKSSSLYGSGNIPEVNKSLQGLETITVRHFLFVFFSSQPLTLLSPGPHHRSMFHPSGLSPYATSHYKN